MSIHGNTQLSTVIGPWIGEIGDSAEPRTARAPTCAGVGITTHNTIRTTVRTTSSTAWEGKFFITVRFSVTKRMTALPAPYPRHHIIFHGLPHAWRNLAPPTQGTMPGSCLCFEPEPFVAVDSPPPTIVPSLPTPPRASATTLDAKARHAPREMQLQAAWTSLAYALFLPRSRVGLPLPGPAIHHSQKVTVRR